MGLWLICLNRIIALGRIGYMTPILELIWAPRTGAMLKLCARWWRPTPKRTWPIKMAELLSCSRLPRATWRSCVSWWRPAPTRTWPILGSTVVPFAPFLLQGSLIKKPTQQKKAAYLTMDTGCYWATKDKVGRTSLMLASGEGYVEVARLLVEALADKDAATNHGLTALMLAAREGHVRVVRLLVEAGADKNLADQDRNTALMLAADPWGRNEP